ncbi:MAG: DUF2218 domain-containing protein [Mycobacteriaceae bacterium]|nr:DUF2218 domain-containing protein [Mycobacteriaceae bacterium]
MPSAVGRVATDRPGRFAEQLAAHVTVHGGEASWTADDGRGQITLGSGSARLLAEPDSLVIHVTTGDKSPETIARLRTWFDVNLYRCAGGRLPVTWTEES